MHRQCVAFFDLHGRLPEDRHFVFPNVANLIANKNMASNRGAGTQAPITTSHVATNVASSGGLGALPGHYLSPGTAHFTTTNVVSGGEQSGQYGAFQRQLPTPGFGMFNSTGGFTAPSSQFEAPREFYQDPNVSRCVGEFRFQLPGPPANVNNTLVSKTWSNLA